MSKTRTRKGFGGLPKTYGKLVALLPPRPIHDDVDFANACEMIDRLAGLNRLCAFSYHHYGEDDRGDEAHRHPAHVGEENWPLFRLTCGMMPSNEVLVACARLLRSPLACRSPW